MPACGGFLRLPSRDEVPCTLPYDHLEMHQLVVHGQQLLVWGRDDHGKGYVSGGHLAFLFPNGLCPWRHDEEPSDG